MPGCFGLPSAQLALPASACFPPCGKAEVACRWTHLQPCGTAPAAKLKRRQAALLRPASSGGGDADGSDYAAALGQKLALCLAAAADDVAAVFGPTGGDAELAAAFLVWALHQTERWVGI